MSNTGNGQIPATNHRFGMSQTTRCIGEGDWARRQICVPARFNTTKAATGNSRVALSFFGALLHRLYCLDVVSHAPYRQNGPWGRFCAMSGPDWSFLPDSASAARRGRATKNEKMSCPCTSRQTLESCLQALREIGKHVAASEQELPPWLSQYALVSFLIAFWSTLCTMCTLVHWMHFVHWKPPYCQECT